MIEIQLLGEIEVRVDGQVLPASRPQQNTVLAALLIDADQPVPLDNLIDRVWGADPPPHARRDVQIHLTRIRKMFIQPNAASPEVTLTRRRSGYLLSIDIDRVDLHRFDRLVEQAHAPDCPDDKRLELLRQAMGLWRGNALGGAPGQWAAQVREACRQRYLDAVVAWADAELRAGRPGAVLAQLWNLAGQYPLVESLTAVLIRAIDASGRPAQALDLYGRTRRLLADELGTDPGPELQAVYRQLLHNEALVPDGQSRPARVRPAQLPPDLPGFVGRTNALRHLDDLLTHPSGGPTMTIASIMGSAGVGKTTLAVHWAHHVADRFPDGQLHVDLHGFQPDSQPADPATVIRRLLETLDVPAQRLPTDPDAQAALYRSLLAGKRMLIVLDNARDSSHVRPLLPGAPGCFVLITSRDQLTELVATHAAHPIALDLLTPGEARQLLATRVGASRIAAEPHAVDEVITRCARLPLALAIVAARAALRPGLTLRAIADELGEGHHDLDTLASGDLTVDLSAVFACSYRTLSAAAAGLFRLLGLHPGPDISAPAAASLCGAPARRTRPLLAELTRAHLLTEHAPSRYVLHDLLRAYAIQQASRIDTDAQRAAARHRALDHYLHSAVHAQRLLHPPHDSITLATAGHGVTAEQPATFAHAHAWFTAEHQVLRASIELAASTGFHVHAWQLAWALVPFYDRQGHWADWAATQHVALAAAARLHDPLAQAIAHRLFARACILLECLDEADRHLHQALPLYSRAGHRIGQAQTHINLARVLELRGDHGRAVTHAEHALALYRAVGHLTGQAAALNAIGWHQAHVGDHTRALVHCQQALALYEHLGHQNGQANTLDSLGYIHQRLEHTERAVHYYQRAIGLLQHLGDRYEHATTRTHLGDTYLAAGDRDAAHSNWRHALTILDDLHHSDADRIRARLDADHVGPLCR